MTNIFISYRRGDSIATAGRIRDRLVQHYGRSQVFVDVDDIPPGADFVKLLSDKVAEAHVMLAIIGPGWLSATDDNGARRLDSPDDFVAIELAAALKKRSTRVMPVLIDDARMPGARDLPDALKPLIRRNAIELRNSQFGADAERLIKAIDAATPSSWRPRRALLATSLAGLFAALAATAAVMYLKPGRPLPPPATVAARPAAVPPARVPLDAALASLRRSLGAAEGRVRVNIKGGNRIPLGRQISFEVTSEIPGRLILVDVNAAGDVVQIFPNSFITSDAAALVSAATTTTIPGVGYGFSGFRATEPLGAGRLIAFVVPAAVPANRLRRIATQQSKGFEPVREPGAYLQQLIEDVAAIATSEPGGRVSGLAYTSTSYEIVP